VIRLLLIILTILSTSAFAGEEYYLKKINLSCGKNKECEDLKQNFKSLRGEYANIEHLKTILKLYVVNEGIKNFNYKIDDNGTLYINLIPKQVVTSVRVKVEGTDMGYPSILPLKEDEFLDSSKISRTKRMLSDIYMNKGFPNVKVGHKFIKNIEQGVGVDFIIKTGKPITVKNINIISNSEYLKGVLGRRISSFENKPFDIQEVKNVVEDVRVLFLSYGYYLAQLTLKYKIQSNRQVDLYIDLQGGDLHKFDVRAENGLLLNNQYKELLSETVVTYKRVLNKKIITQLIQENLNREGYLFPEILVDVKNYINQTGDKVYLYKVQVNKGVRSYVSELEFRGNYIIKEGALKKLYYENAFEQASLNIYDDQYYKNYVELLRQAYIKKGYVNVFIDKPQIKILPKSKNVKVVFRIREGLPTKISRVRVKGVSTDLKKLLLSKVSIKSKESFNPVAFKESLEIIEKILKQQGFYFSRIINKTETSIVKYNKDNSQVEINIEIDLDKRLFVNNLIIIGNRKTRTKFIVRELFLRKGDIITPNLVDSSQTNLLSSGLFSSVNIRPVKNISNKADILISVREKDFGLVEIAPGIRTDLGPKFSTSISYNNLDGMNKKITFKGQVNQRFDLTVLDEQRRQDSNSLLEYSTLVNYSENHIFNSEWDFSTSISKSRKRFFSFDADIQKISFTTSWDITKIFSTSFTYQLETISQFDSTIEREHGHFQIGSLTPGLTVDLRNNRINPTKGAYFNLTYEMANPTFLSQANDELVVNYYKIVSRNRFYLQIPNGVLAMSLAAGYQKNLATDKKSDGTTAGYIPNIKVFRLSGMDIVRGFEDDEINRLVTQQDISEARVEQKAYMANIKIEPRFFLSDATMLGVFYDAGRVYVDSYDLSQLRSSAGISFKYLTPVGSLDFDYGIKLLRKRDDDGKLESPGRLHVSIGFF
jgi:outer membrane protein insertion porin family